MGFRVSTLIHELAHLEGVSGHHHHRKDFKQAQDKLLRFWETHINTRLGQSKLTLKTKVSDVPADKYGDARALLKKAGLDRSFKITHYVTPSGFETTRTEYL